MKIPTINSKIVLMGLVSFVLISAGVFVWKSFDLDLPQIVNTQRVLSNIEVVEVVKPATVYIETTECVGSGMIIDAEGYILTNAHVVAGVSTAKIKLSDGKLYSAEVKGRDEIIDIAILKISGENFPFVKFGDSDAIVQGSNVFTLGYPFGLEGDVSFKEGTISRRISDGDVTYLETSAEIHPGNSGGPLVNHFGEVVGVNSAGFGESIEGVTIGETIKLAIPINTVKDLISDLKVGKEILAEEQPTKPSSQQKPSAPTSISADCTSALAETKEEYDEGLDEVDAVRSYSPYFSEYLGRCVVESIAWFHNIDKKFIYSKIIVDSKDQSIIAEFTTADGELITTLSEKEYEDLKRRILYAI